MDRYLRLTWGFLLLFFLFACQKELSFEQGQKSKGSLQSVSGDCNPKTVGGTFKASQALGDTNFIEVTVNVSQTGTYTIFTDTINGYYFMASGTFSSTGAATVRLKGFGTPAAAGIDDFSVSYDSSVCNVAVTVLPGGGGGGGSSSAFTLGNCSNTAVQGTYTQGTAVTATNRVQVEVNVTALGTWNLSTSTVTGFSFSGSGTFTALGTQMITLNAAGTPTTAGQQSFTVTAASANCNFNVTVAPSSTPPAVFTLAGAPGACGGFTPSGTYTQGVALTSGNTVLVQVNVTTPGQWSVSTNTVAGMTFAGTGTFTSAGLQTITLNGTGNPSASGPQTFTVTAGSSTCTFVITVAANQPPSNTDHFPLTANSYWTYNDPSTAGDTIKRINNNTFTIGGNTYRTFEEFDQTGTSNGVLLYRRSGNDYFEYTSVHNYAIITFDDPEPEGDILFLKEGLTTNATWNSAEYTGTENGVTKKLRYSFTCTDANASNVVINGKTFNNVYKITFKPQVSTGGGSFTDEGLVWEAFYAQGVGLIHLKGTFGAQTLQYNIRYYQVF